MRLDIVPRGEVSSIARILSPIGAVIVAILIGGLIVAALGKSPLQALFVYFIDPLSESWTIQELAVKGTPLILIAPENRADCTLARKDNIQSARFSGVFCRLSFTTRMRVTGF